MAGELKEDIVVIPDQKEGSQIYNKGNYGYPISKGGLNLDLLEATYLLESKRLEVTLKGKDVSFEELFKHSSSIHEDFDIRYMVFRDIRSRGFVVKNETGDFDFSVFPRGKTISNSRPEFMVKAVSERTAFDMRTFSDNVEKTRSKEKKLLYAVVDEEGDLTYYVVSTKEPVGKLKTSSAGPFNGSLIRDRVFVFNADDANAVHENGFFGKIDDGTLQLSLIEAYYLMKKGILNATASGKLMTVSEMEKFGSEVQNEFTSRSKTFDDLRDKGLLVKTGFKYGTHFRVYEGSPDKCHARYLVHSVDGKKKMTWPEISRTVRLAHGVKKEILFADSENGKYTEFKRFRP